MFNRTGKDKKNNFFNFSYEIKDNLVEYDDMIQFALNDSKVGNIGVLGDFGVGKSSVIRSFFNKRKKEFDNKVAYITLGIGSEQSDEKIRRNILNKIIQQIPSSKIRKSHFKSKSLEKKWKSFLNLLIVVICFICSLIIIQFETISKFDYSVIWKGLNFINSDIFFIWVLFVLVASIIYIIFQMPNFIYNIKSISLLGNEIGIKDTKAIDIFDVYLDEVVYIIRKSGFKHFVFEDLDRTENSKVLYELGSLNDTLNAFGGKGDTIKFFYLVKDSFLGNDNFKFYDFVIPIIPVQSFSNVTALLKISLSTILGNHQITTSKLDRYGLFISDIRLIRWICNELKFYLSILERNQKFRNKTPEINLHNSLFVFILYKTMFTSDYSLFLKSESRLQREVNLIRYNMKNSRLYTNDMNIDKIIDMAKKKNKNIGKDEEIIREKLSQVHGNNLPKNFPYRSLLQPILKKYSKLEKTNNSEITDLSKDINNTNEGSGLFNEIVRDSDCNLTIWEEFININDEGDIVTTRYIINATNKKGKTYPWIKLDNEHVLKELMDNDFTHIESINYPLLEYMYKEDNADKIIKDKRNTLLINILKNDSLYFFESIILNDMINKSRSIVKDLISNDELSKLFYDVIDKYATNTEQIEEISENFYEFITRLINY